MQVILIVRVLMGCETEIDFRIDLVIGCMFWGWGGLDLLVCVCFYCGLFFFFV